MENFIVKSPYFHLVLLSLCFNFFKTSMSSIYLNCLHTVKMPVTEIHDGLLYFFINDAG